MAARKKAAKKRTPIAVKYIGTADVKQYLGFEWNHGNDHTLSTADIDADTLANLRSQPDFRLVYE